MIKQSVSLPGTNDPSDFSGEVRENFVRQLNEWKARKQRHRNMEAAALLSADEVARLNAAIEAVAVRLGIRGELATIDSLLQLRNTRVARILTAAYLVE